MMQEKRDGGGGGGGGGCCYFHPKEVVVGVCPLCLHEKLLLLASSSSSTQRHQYFPSPSKSIINIFTFPSLLNPLHFFHHSNSNLDHHDLDDLDTSTSQEDSFISMKIGDNGAGSWEGKNMNVPKKLVFLDNLHVTTKDKSQKLKEEEKESNKKSLVEHAKGTRSALRWRKRIGQAFQLVRWKRSNKANVWHVGTKVEGVKVMRKHKQGWIANLTKRKTK